MHKKQFPASVFLFFFILSFLSLSPYPRRTPHPDPLSRLCPAPDQPWVRLYHSAKEQSSPQSLGLCVCVSPLQTKGQLSLPNNEDNNFQCRVSLGGRVVSPCRPLADETDRRRQRHPENKKGLEGERTRAGTGEPQAASCANQPPPPRQ